MTVRSLFIPLLAIAALGLAGCGGSDESRARPALGSPQNPIPAVTPDPEGMTGETAGNPAKLGYSKLLENQRKEDTQTKQGNPCALVTKRQAQVILGGRLLDPVSLPQGPTCVYRSRSSRRYATISVQTGDFRALRRKLRRAERFDVADRSAYCGTHGRPMLYLPVGQGRVLSVAAQCDTAVRLARRAGARLLP